MKRLFALLLLLLLVGLGRAQAELRPLEQFNEQALVLTADRTTCAFGLAPFAAGLRLEGEFLQDRPLPAPTFSRALEAQFGCRIQGFLLEYAAGKDVWRLQNPFHGLHEVDFNYERFGLGWGLGLIKHRLYLDALVGSSSLTYRLAQDGAVLETDHLTNRYASLGLTWYLTPILAANLQSSQGQGDGLASLQRLGLLFYKRF